jgi:glycosyltransferase involved in cell wall biosynthesis
MYFAKYLKKLGWEPIIITVDEQQASYPVWDESLLEEVAEIRVIKTTTREPLRWYSLLTSGNSQEGVPQGEVKRQSLLGKIAAFIRGNYFIPDARKGWVSFAVKAAQKLLKEESIFHLISTGPPHSTHLVGLQLKAQFDINWWVDFRDPWTEIFYIKDLYRSQKAIQKDALLENKVLQTADGVLTTLGGALHSQLSVKAPNQNFVSIPNGYDVQLMQEVQATKPKEVFHVVYTGLLTENQAYDSVLHALNNIAEQQAIRFSLAGKIAPDIISNIRAALPKVEVVYQGYLSHKEAIGLMKSAHLLLNFIFIGAQTQMISGKLLEYMATNVPVLSIGDPNSEVGKFISKGSFAKMLDANDRDGIQTFVGQLAAKKETLRNDFPNIKSWSREVLTQRLVEEVFFGD